MTDRDEARRLFYEALEHYDAQRFGDAERLLREADRLAPDTAPVVTNLAAALYRQGDNPTAARYATEALRLDPDSIAARIVLGSCQNDAGHFSEALGNFDVILAVRPGDVEANLGRGIALAGLGRPDEAVAAYRRTLELDPKTARALAGIGRIHLDANRFAQAAAAFDAAAVADPNYPYVKGSAIRARMTDCDWRGLEESWVDLLLDIRAGKSAAMPFVFLGVPASAADQLLCAKLALREHVEPLPPFAPPRREGRIRLAYVSADFHEHAVPNLAAGLFEHHDRSKFETFAFSLGRDGETPMRARLMRAFEHFIPVRERSDREIAETMRERGIDIAVDLSGFTGDGRPGIFAYRAAPVQVNFLGYPGTMGSEDYDYILADPTIIPPEDFGHYAEKVVHLPGSYQVNDRSRPRPTETAAPVDPAIEAADFIFASFNASYKITPDIFDVWMRILGRVPGSVLWLHESAPAVPANLRREAEARCIAGRRLVFAKPADLPTHLGRYNRVGLFLDTLHYNAHTTASDALWMGVPVVTMPGPSFPSRVAASLLKAAGQPELVTRSLAEYEELAVTLATDRGRLARLRARIEESRLACRLFDTEAFTRNIEAAYQTMVERQRNGEAPASFRIP